MDWEDTKQHFCILLYQEIIIKNNLNNFLIIKAKYYVIEPYYMEGTTPDGPVVFSGSPCLIGF